MASASSGAVGRRDCIILVGTRRWFGKDGVDGMDYGLCVACFTLTAPRHVGLLLCVCVTNVLDPFTYRIGKHSQKKKHNNKQRQNKQTNKGQWRAPQFFFPGSGVSLFLFASSRGVARVFWSHSPLRNDSTVMHIGLDGAHVGLDRMYSL